MIFLPDNPEHALVCLDRVIERTHQRGFLAGETIARVRRAYLRVQIGELEAARAELSGIESLLGVFVDANPFLFLKVQPCIADIRDGKTDYREEFEEYAEGVF